MPPDDEQARDPEAPATIPGSINEVVLEFDPGVNRGVRSSLIDLLRAVIRPNVAPGWELRTLYVSSAADRHALPSRHAMGRAVDFSRINKKHMSIHYLRDAEITEIVDALIRHAQICGPTFVAREVFGPGPHPHGVKLRLGASWPQVRDHTDHVHLSEGDREAIPGCPWPVPTTG